MADLNLPSDVKKLVHLNTHPGLQLDKYSPAGDQKEQKSALENVCRRRGFEDQLKALRVRRGGVLESLGAKVFMAKTTGPFTLHLSRSTALENAGICMHPLYGFVYIPGSGLKGMARAFAETVWLPQQKDQQEASEKIISVFGNDPPGGDKKKVEYQAGNVVFHEAWPTKWPNLIVDIVNNHHQNYYQGKDNENPPGDWEDPIPVNFLAVPAGEKFDFALAKRTKSVADDILNNATEWLIGALTHLGAGAKTNAGYGTFEVVEQPEAVKRARKVWCGELIPEKRTYLEETFPLELVTPAFLAGATQDATDCDLRPATLRGLLRWWWRTMHSGFMDVKTLRELEAAIWGDTKAGGAIQITIGKNLAPDAYIFDRNQVIRDHRLERSPDRRTAQGLTYLSYGTAERGSQRCFVAPGTSWNILLSARDRGFREFKLSKELVFEQAKMALQLLCHFGGIGSKSRNGFGSFIDLPDFSINNIKQFAQQFHQACGFKNSFIDKWADSPSLDWLAGIVEVPTPWKNEWYAIDQLGFAAQSFAKRYKHQRVKMSLGLPRKIGPPANGDFRSPRFIKDRHASPVFYHLVKQPDDTFLFRITAFVAKNLPDPKTSESFLKEFVTFLKADLQERTWSLSDRGRQQLSPSKGALSSPGQKATKGFLPKAGDFIEATLLEEKTKKGGWKAKHEPSGLSGAIHNPSDVPADKKAGNVLILQVASVTPKELNFRWIKDK